MTSIDLLRTLTDAIGPSGFEDEPRAAIRQLVEPLVDHVRVDAMGNLIATRRGSGDLTLLLDAHMDEIGFIVRYVEPDGFLRFQQTSGWDARIVPAHAVTILTDLGTRVRGYIGTAPPHILSAEDREKPYKLDDLFIDLGVSSAADVAALGIRPGSPFVISYPFEQLNDQVVMARALDNRAACAVIIQTLQSLAKVDLDVTLVASFSVQEEVGLRGAGVVAHAVRPDLALVLETTVAADVPGIPLSRRPTAFGQGPAFVVMDNTMITPPRLVRAVTEFANERLIPWQYRIPYGGGTNAGAIQRTRNGITTGVISIPVRYFHSPYALMRLDDFDNTTRLVTDIAFSARSLITSAQVEA